MIDGELLTLNRASCSRTRTCPSGSSRAYPVPCGSGSFWKGRPGMRVRLRWSSDVMPWPRRISWDP